MRCSRLHPLLAVLCALFLLGAQQAAYAHFLGHLGMGGETVAAENGEAEHSAASSLAHVCTTCAALSALDVAPPPAALHRGVEPVSVAPVRPAPVAHLPAFPAPPYASRAPPSVL